MLEEIPRAGKFKAKAVEVEGRKRRKAKNDFSRELNVVQHLEGTNIQVNTSIIQV